MGKKGMTLIELIAVIAIIAVIATLVAPNLMGTRTRGLNKSMQVKLDRISNAALSYANDNLANVPSRFMDKSLSYTDGTVQKCLYAKTFDTSCKDADGNSFNCNVCEKYCLVVYVKTLVNLGYIAGDGKDKQSLVNPFGGGTLNYERVCVMYDSDEVSANNSRNQARKLVAYIVDEDKLYEK